MHPSAGARHGVVAPVRVDPRGQDGPTRHAAAGAEWRRASRGLYVPAWVPMTPEQRIVEAGSLVPRYGAISGWAALRWAGAEWFSGTRGAETLPVTLCCARAAIRAQAGVRLCQERFDPFEVGCIDGVVVASPVRAVCFAMRYAATLEEAVQMLDMVAHADLVTVAEAAYWADQHPSYTGIERCRQACALADENAWSPMETVPRLRWSPTVPLLTNHPVFDLEGRVLLTPDLLDPAAGVAAEYEGRLHLSTPQRHVDVERAALYRRLGIEAVTMTSGDLRGNGFERRLAEAYARAAAHPAGDRSWTVVLPKWWVRTDTVEARRALTDEQRARWLRRGAA